MKPAAPAGRPPPVLSESTLVPLGFVVVVIGALIGMARWVATIETRQASDREIASMLIDQLKNLTEATQRAGEDAAATRAQLHMIVRELDRTPRRSRD
jgi:hypothetical protein